MLNEYLYFYKLFLLLHRSGCFMLRVTLYIHLHAQYVHVNIITLSMMFLELYKRFQGNM